MTTDTRTPLQLFEEHRVWAERFARALARRLPGRPNPDELANTALIALWEAAGRYRPRPDCRFRTYAGDCVRGQILNYVRGEMRSRRVALADTFDELEDRPEPEVPVEEIGQALRRLDRRGRRAIRLRFTRGLRMREVAERLGVCRATAHKIVRDALAQLRTNLEGVNP
jgi:RNA polymerase sigma factor (sigma-70 family)